MEWNWGRPLVSVSESVTVSTWKHTQCIIRAFLGSLHVSFTCIPMDERGVLRYSSALDTSTALSHVWTELWLPSDACLLPAADSMAMVTALVLSRLSVELYMGRPRLSVVQRAPRGGLPSW